MTQEQSHRRRSRTDRKRPVLVTSSTTIENEESGENGQNTENGYVEEVEEVGETRETADAMVPVAPQKPARRLPGFFSTIGRKTEAEESQEVDVAQARLARATRKAGAGTASKEVATTGTQEPKQEAKKPAASTRAATTTRPTSGFKTRYLIGMVIYLLGANFIGIFEASFLTANHLNIVLTTFNLFGGTIVISTSTLVFLLTLILLLILLAKFDLIPRSLSAMGGSPASQRGQSNNRNTNQEANTKTPPPVMKQGVKGEDDDLYDEYRANQRYMQRRARKR